jgi:hypothetical protein
VACCEWRIHRREPSERRRAADPVRRAIHNYRGARRQSPNDPRYAAHFIVRTLAPSMHERSR